MDLNLFVFVLLLHKMKGEIKRMQIHFCGMEMTRQTSQGSLRGCRTQPGVVLAFTTTSIVFPPRFALSSLGRVYGVPACVRNLRQAPNGVWSSLPLRR